jgi:hypothetical protein
MLASICAGRPGTLLLQSLADQTRHPLSSDVVNLPSGDNATFLLVAALMAGVAISDPAFESTASAIH